MTCFEAWSLYLSKFLENRTARSEISDLNSEALPCQAFAGFKISSGTPGHFTGTLKLKTSNFS